ncbi:MAG: superoxide dismutase family protein [Clostridiaceae bacterium]
MYNHIKSSSMVAVANVKGGPLAPNLKGTVFFVDVPNGTNVFVEIDGLPDYKPSTSWSTQIGPHGFHIHEMGSCEVGDKKDPFSMAGGHYNPDDQPHGNHAGDFPVLFSNGGISKMVFFTNKLKVKDIIGKAIVIHEGPDDYKTQPAGGSGKRLGCGVIEQYK